MIHYSPPPASIPIALDPNNHNTVYAGTGDLNYGSFSMGSQGIFKSTDGGANWTVLGANIFGAALPQPVGQFPQYQAVGKVRVDPNNSNNVVAGTKTGLYFSYDGGTNWTGPCITNSFPAQRQDITALELTNMGGGITRILAAVGVRGFATTVQFNLNLNGANGIYSATMPASGCPRLCVNCRQCERLCLRHQCNRQRLHDRCKHERRQWESICQYHQRQPTRPY